MARMQTSIVSMVCALPTMLPGAVNAQYPQQAILPAKEHLNKGWYRFPPEIIQHAISLYLRFTLSYRDFEELLAERGSTSPRRQFDVGCGWSADILKKAVAIFSEPPR